MFTLPKITYEYSDLEPYIDSQTMELHHSKHHQTYVDKLNDAIKNTEWADTDIETLLSDLNSLPDNIRNVVRNNGGGHWNHSFFWECMAPNTGGLPQGRLHDMFVDSFGSFEQFKEDFGKEAVARFGSGWVWLLKESDKLKITSTPNQDTPIMEGIRPILGLDVWEHAYYLKYQNRRPEYVTNWWEVVDWSAVEARL